jgi:hypothetical protein
MENFNDLMAELFNQLIREAEVSQAAAERFDRNRGTKKFTKDDDDEHFSYYHKTVVAMNLNATNTYKTFRHLDAICDVALEVASSKKEKKRIKKIIKIIGHARLQDLAFAERLPFSKEESWGPKISKKRRWVNIIREIMVWPVLRGEKRKAFYSRTLVDIKKQVDAHNKKYVEADEYKETNKLKSAKKIDDSVKNFRVFKRVSRLIVRAYNRSKDRVFKQMRKLPKYNLPKARLIYYSQTSELAKFWKEKE